MKIGNIILDNPFILAPMAGVSDLPFRLLCREQQAAMVCMEMISAKALHYKSAKTRELTKTEKREAPVALQIFGSEPDIMGEAAATLSEEQFDILDINMGCPMPKIVNNHEGSALMRDLKLAGRIIEEVVRYSKKPVTVKMRLGFDEEHINAPELAYIAQEQGAAAVSIHGRTSQQYYSGKADWTLIGEIKNNLSIPVIGNGDIYSAEDGMRMLSETGCDACLVARGARGNPWIFRELKAKWSEGKAISPPSLQERKEMILKHINLQIEYMGEYIGIRQMRKHVGWYISGMRNSAGIRAAACLAETKEELYSLIENLEE